MSAPSLEDGRPRVSTAWILTFGLLYLAVNVSWAGPSQLLIGNQVYNWEPERKEQLFALIMAVGGLFSLLVTPLWGVLSDRTRSRFGRRSPWIVGGSIASAVALVGLGLAPGFAVLLVGWVIFQVAIAAAVNASLALPADMVSRSQFGVVSGVMGISYTLALVLGTLLASSLSILTAYVVTAVLLLAGIAPFLLRFGATPVLDTPPPQVAEPAAAGEGALGSGADGAFAGGAFAGGSAVVAEDADGEEPTEAAARGGYGDFMKVALSRLAATLGNTVALFYLLYYLRDRIGMADPDLGVLILTGVYAACAVAASIISGRLSDRSGTRRPYVAVGALGVSAACVLMMFAHSFWVVVIAAVILGLAWGIFTAVDQALINQVLPSASTRGRDMGLMSLAVGVPNMLAPVVAAFSLSMLGGYAGLYLTAAVLAAVGALSVMTVRGSR